MKFLHLSWVQSVKKLIQIDYYQLRARSDAIKPPLFCLKIITSETIFPSISRSELVHQVEYTM